MPIYRFQVIQTSRDPSLSIFMLLDVKNRMEYLVHHTLNRTGTYMYTGGKRNPLPFDGNIITDKSQHKRNSKTNKSTFFFHSKPMEEGVILNAQYMG